MKPIRYKRCQAVYSFSNANKCSRYPTQKYLISDGDLIVKVYLCNKHCGNQYRI